MPRQRADMAEQCRMFAGVVARALELFALHHRATDPERRHSAECADGERNAPAPGLELRRRQHDELQDQKHCERGELTHDQGDVLKAGVETAPAGRRHL